MALCPVCNNPAEFQEFDAGERKRVSCQGCGDFTITATAQRLLQGKPGKPAIVSHWLRLACERGEEPEIDQRQMEQILEDGRLTSIVHQANRLIVWLGDKFVEIGGAHSRISLTTDHRKVAAIVGAAPEPGGGLMYVIKQLIKKGLVYPPTVFQYHDEIGLTFEGWERYHALKEPVAPIAPYSLHELPIALDFLNYVWRSKMGGPLLEPVNFEKTLSLGRSCSTSEELQTRVGDLSELFRKFEIPDNLLPAGRSIPADQKLNRLKTCLLDRCCEAEDSETIKQAVDKLRDINTVRNKLSHGGSRELIEALSRMDIAFPIEDFGKAWSRLVTYAIAAVTAIREFLVRIQG